MRNEQNRTANGRPLERPVGRIDPKRDALCARVMQEIDAYIKRYDVRGPAWPIAGAASDVCDGWVTRYELQPLLDARRLRLSGRPYSDSSICGDPFRHWSVELSAREIQRRYADRVTHNSNSTPDSVG